MTEGEGVRKDAYRERDGLGKCKRGKGGVK